MKAETKQKYKTLKRLQKELYYDIWEELDKFLLKTNPCQFDGNVCIDNRQPKGERYGSHAEKNGCCQRCEHLSDVGCKIKSLGCKAYLCLTARNRLTPSEVKELNEIKVMIDRSRISVPIRTETYKDN